MKAVVLMLAIFVMPPCIGAILATIRVKLQHMAFARLHRGDYDERLRADWRVGSTQELEARLLAQRNLKP